MLRRENCFPNDVALFYCAEIVLALEFLHKHKIAYRDMKPENLLISSEGHIKITDFGFAKQINDRTFTLCGTPEYLAPEIIMSIGHNHGVDWWALGVLIYEMVAGYPPFYDENPFEVYRQITVGEFEFPSQVSVNAREIILGLLEPDLSKRMGCMVNAAKDIKDSNWFAGVEWTKVANKEIIPPWVPEIESDLDDQYFEEYPDSGSEIKEPSAQE